MASQKVNNKRPLVSTENVEPATKEIKVGMSTTTPPSVHPSFAHRVILRVIHLCALH